MKLHFGLVILGAVLVQGCSQSMYGGGQTSRGNLVVAEASQGIADGKGQFTLTSLDGWQCRGKAANHGASAPLACNNGLSGTSQIGLGAAGDAVDISFRLSNGTSGEVELER